MQTQTLAPSTSEGNQNPWKEQVTAGLGEVVDLGHIALKPEVSADQAIQGALVDRFKQLRVQRAIADFHSTVPATRPSLNLRSLQSNSNRVR